MTTNTGSGRLAEGPPAAPAMGPGSRRISFARIVPAVAGRLAQLVWVIVGVVDAILVLDFAFRLIGARDTGFVHGVYTVGSTLASPFSGIFANVPRLGGYTLTWSDGVAVLLCTIAGWAIVRLIRIAGGPRHRRAF